MTTAPGATSPTSEVGSAQSAAGVSPTAIDFLTSMTGALTTIGRGLVWKFAFIVLGGGITIGGGALAVGKYVLDVRVEGIQREILQLNALIATSTDLLSHDISQSGEHLARVISARADATDKFISERTASLEQRIDERTDGGKLNSALTNVVSQLSALSTLPARQEALQKEVSGMNREIGETRVKIESLDRRLDSEFKDLQRRLPLRSEAPESPDRIYVPMANNVTIDPNISYSAYAGIGSSIETRYAAFLSAVPVGERKRWADIIKKMDAAGVRTTLIPAKDQSVFVARLEDPAILQALLRVGFRQVNSASLPSGTYVRVP